MEVDQENSMATIATLRIKQEFIRSFDENQIENADIDEESIESDSDSTYSTENSFVVKSERPFEIENNENVHPNQRNIFNDEITRELNNKNSHLKKSHKPSIHRCTGRIGVKKQKRRLNRRIIELIQAANLDRTIDSSMLNDSIQSESEKNEIEKHNTTEMEHSNDSLATTSNETVLDQQNVQLDELHIEQPASNEEHNTTEMEHSNNYLATTSNETVLDQQNVQPDELHIEQPASNEEHNTTEMEHSNNYFATTSNETVLERQNVQQSELQVEEKLKDVKKSAVLCEVCQHAYVNKSSFTNHTKTQKHKKKMAMTIVNPDSPAISSQ